MWMKPGGRSRHLVDFQQRDAAGVGRPDLRGVGAGGEVDQDRRVGAAGREGKRPGAGAGFRDRGGIGRGTPTGVERDGASAVEERQLRTRKKAGDAELSQPGTDRAD